MSVEERRKRHIEIILSDILRKKGIPVNNNNDYIMYVLHPGQSTHFGGAGICEDIEEAIDTTIKDMEQRCKNGNGAPKTIQSLMVTIQPACFPRLCSALFVYWIM